VSLEPPLVLVCIEKKTGSHYALEQSSSFVVNILREDQQYISDRFASYLSNKFDGIEYYSGNDDLPVLTDVLANLECRLVNTHDNGDHTIYVGQIEKAVIKEGKPLIYWHGNYRHLST
jgi:flavin reductase (DIM6/NTAB) family NADH-FMN oxidoreductase RutF